jgi:sterol desaturase/sphingolipid hydroxylase (fatty acid hydroxylase superfamily)
VTVATGAAIFNPGTLRLLAIGVLVATPLELFVPRRRQKIFPRSALINLAHATLTVSISGVLLVAVLGALSILPSMPAVGRAIAALPFPFAFAIVVGLGEIGYYWAHRASHELTILWRFHRVHHSATEMSWVAAARAHPVDQVVLQVGALLPLHLAGVGVASYGLYGVFVIVQNLVVHANVDIGIGPLRWILATPDFHQWHHAADRKAWNKNYAGQLPILDVLFGSIHFPYGREPIAYGIAEPLRESYVGHLAAPLVDAARWASART